MPDLSFEQQYSGMIAGIDEAGRGPWAGPVVAAAVILNPTDIPHGIDDSKKLSRTRREALFQQISAQCWVGIGIVAPAVIDDINILNATKQAMCLAVQQLISLPDVVLVDGNQPPALPCKTVPIIGGDSKSLSIAAASIIAKVTRDRIMEELALVFPQYGWEKNAGYGTKEHVEAIALWGITPHHRRSFAPIRKALENTQKHYDYV